MLEQLTKKILTESVTITGKGFWGGASGLLEFPRKEAQITFHPYDKAGWWWKTKKYGDIPIDSSIAECGKSEITLRYKDEELHVWEHIGVLRFTGIDQVLIESTPWPPYHGRAWELYEKILKEGKLKSTNEKFLFTSIEEEIVHFYKKGFRYTMLSQTLYKEVDVSIFCQWGNLPMIQRRVSVTPEFVEEIIQTHAQGYPSYRYPIAKLCARIGLFEHFDKVVWPKEYPSKKESALLFFEHRVADLLGALSLIDHERLPRLKVTTEFGGHKSDLMALKASTPHI